MRPPRPRPRKARAAGELNGRPPEAELTPTEVHTVVDEHEVGDIHGAFGSIRKDDRTARRTWRHRLLTLAAIMGPGLIVMIGDNDAGGLSTYAQAGQNYGYSLLWVLPVLIPVLIVNQEMVVRLGAVTGVGYARLINERFGRFWGLFSAGSLFLLNFLTIVTEFIGISLAAQYFGISSYLAVPISALALIGITASGNFQRWERAMFVFLVGSLLVIPLAVLAHPDGGRFIRGALIPGVQGGLTSNSVLLLIAIIGTTIAPWQLFFQQSNVVDKRITPRWMVYAKADTVIGAFIVVGSAAALMAAAAAAFTGTREYGLFSDALGTASGLGIHVSRLTGAIFALLLFDASIVGASAVTLATSYAFGDVFGLRHSLNRGIREAKVFYGSYSGLVAVAAAVVLIPQAPLGIITTAVQALAGILLPSSTVFLVLLCNDADVLGPWVNRPWLNIVATIVVSVLLMLSLILVVSTAVPSLDVRYLVAVLGAILAAALAGAGAWYWRGRSRAAPPPLYRHAEDWRMPPSTLLTRPAWSRARRFAMLGLSGYLVVAVLLLVVKAAQLAIGTH